MVNTRVGIAVSSAAFLVAALAGCVMGEGAGTGKAIFCVQDETNVNVTGVFVTFGSIQLNLGAEATDTEPIDNDTLGNTTGPANETGNATDNATSPTTNATAPTTTEATTGPNETGGANATDDGTTGGSQTILPDEVRCARVEGQGAFEDIMRGQVGQDDLEDEGDGFGDETSGTVDVEAGEINLLDFQNSSAAFLAEANLSAGMIEMIRVQVDDVRVTDANGQELNVTVPSGEIKIVGPIEIQEGHTTLVVLKVDLERSLVVAGQSGQVIFQPVVRVLVTEPVAEITVEENVVVATGNETSPTMGNTTAPMSPENTTTPPPTTTQATTAAPTTTTSPYP